MLTRLSTMPIDREACRNRRRSPYLALVIGLLLAFSPACKRESQPAGTNNGAGTTAGSQPAGEDAASSTQPRPADADDDFDAPRALPKSTELEDWTKTEPVRVATGAQIESLLPAGRLRTLLQFYRIERAATCRYINGGLSAAVTLVRAATPEDAFGVFSLAGTGPLPPVRVDFSMTREMAGAGEGIVGWQGSTVVQIRLSGQDTAAAKEAGLKLLDRILFNVPAAQLPLLLQAVPDVQQTGCQLWLVRATAALKYADNNVVRLLNPTMMDTRLGLDGNVLLSVAAVQVAEDERPNVIWLGQYPTAEAARAAHDRYLAALESPATALDRNTLPGAAKGNFFAGSWTADQESVQNLLKLLEQVLPEVPTSQPAS